MSERDRQGIGAFLFDELRRAFQDIRQRAVEEGWFGRVTTPYQRNALDHAPSIEPEPDREPSFDDLYGSSREETAPERETAPDRGIDL